MKKWIYFGVLFVLFLFPGSIFSQPDVTRTLFTPPVVPETQTAPVRFEATVTGSPASVFFNYNGVDRPMFDNGTNGDATAGDSVWTILFTANEILSKNNASRVFRPIIGTCRPLGGGSFNVIGEVWTSEIGLRTIQPIDATGQESDYIVNYVASTSQLLNFDPRVWSRKFYLTHPDSFDFINFVLIGGTRGNRNHGQVKNTVQGIGIAASDNTIAFGSGGNLKGVTTYPIPTFYDAGEASFSHETGHQWINFLAGTPYAIGTPHWPAGNIAINVMGISIGGPNGVGGTYQYTFTPNGSGGYVVGAGNNLNLSTFNTMELYLMGLASPAEVGAFFTLNNQNQAITVGQTLLASEITPVTVAQIVAVSGTRVPNSTQSQKNFRTATIVLSEQLLDPRSMALYDYFTRRGESQQQLPYASGLVSGVGNPWFLATGGRSQMITQISSLAPNITVSGRVLTPSGATIRNAVVAITDSSGVRRTVTSSSFGVYTINNIVPGNYTITASTKRYRFAPQQLAINNNLTNLDFVGLE